MSETFLKLLSREVGKIGFLLLERGGRESDQDLI